MGNEAFTEAQEKQIVEVIRATVAEVLRQQEAQKRRGDTESQARVAAHIERQREQLEQIRAEQAAEHGDPIRAMFYRMGAELLGDEITATPARSPASTQAHTPLPETDPGAMDEPEWAADSVQELIDFIDSYEK